MSRHHAASRHSSRAPKLRAKVARLLPARCLDCPHAVLPEHRWQLGHIIPAADGGQTVMGNVGPSHSWCPACKRACNQSAGGKLGAAVTNARRGVVARAERDLRPW